MGETTPVGKGQSKIQERQPGFLRKPVDVALLQIREPRRGDLQGLSTRLHAPARLPASVSEPIQRPGEAQLSAMPRGEDVLRGVFSQGTSGVPHAAHEVCALPDALTLENGVLRSSAVVRLHPL